jgi:poly-gamma-glutamate capsule biosynthesis protein CapA/YwtB (metallophosphatase superfamily)
MLCSVSPIRLTALALAGALISPAVPAAAQRSAASGQSADRLRLGVSDGFTFAAVGDLIQTHPVAQARTAGLAEAIALLQRATVTFGNFESTAIDLRSFSGYPQAEYGGLWVRSDPSVVPDLARNGFDLVARANNHATDWGLEGMRQTDRRLDEVGIVHAGTGETRAAARAARYLTTPQGTVALVSMASSFTPISRSMDPLREAPGRPGINPLRTTRRVLVSPEMLRSLRAIYAAQPKGSFLPPADSSPTTLSLFGTQYRASPAVRDQVGFEYEADSVDVREIMAAIRQGKQNADFLVATIHAHEPGNWSDQPPDFLRALAHVAIDNGADAFVGHGPHQLRGIEIYRGRPIFYSLGNFFFQVSSLEPIAKDLYEQFHRDPDSTGDAEFHEWWRKKYFGGQGEPIWYRSVIAVTRYEGGQASEIRLYPVELGVADSGVTKGVPRIAPPEVARAILATLDRLSRPYGTSIEIEGDVGVIRPRPVAAGSGR